MAGHHRDGGANIAWLISRAPQIRSVKTETFLLFVGVAVSIHMVSVFAQRVLPLTVLAVAAISVPVLMLSPTGLPRLRNLEEERHRADEEVSRLSSQIAALRAEVSRIKTDPAAVERAARDELGLVRTTEVVFQFSD
jgi:cell division protein FtsB